MSKVTAPLLSFGASGQVGKSVVFSTWRGIKYARRHVVPANPQTTSQTFQRSSFAQLREAWKRMSGDGRAPWTAYSAGRPFTGMNAFIGENRLAIGTDADMQAFEGSPGSGGGLPPATVAAVAGGSSGEIDVTLTYPAAPVDWTLTQGWAAAFPDQAPDATWGGLYVVEHDTAGDGNVTLAGLGSAVDCVVTGWSEWTKPDGTTAYGPSLVTTATSAV